MTADDDDATPARLTSKPSWLLSQAAMHGHRLLTDGLAPAGSRGYHYRLLARVQDELVAPLSPGERAQLVRLLTRIVEHHGAAR